MKASSTHATTIIPAIARFQGRTTEITAFKILGRIIPASPGPAGFRPGDPCPDLLNEQEAIRYLRLDEIKIKNPGETLRYYRKKGNLRGTQIGKVVFYSRKELDSFIEKVTKENPR